MKKLLFAVVLVLLILAALSSTALADNGPHGRFNGSTDACASCHRIHSAVSGDGMQLVHSEVYDLCTACHDGSGAATNVVDGYYDTAHTTKSTTEGQADHGLFGGGFVNTRMLTDYGNTATQ
ncbi:MAG: cytochrome c3 family protein, partial [Chloroflexota bacterium]